MQHFMRMSKIHILIGLLLLLCFYTRAQKEIIIYSLSRSDKVELRNYVDGKLINSVFDIKKRAIQIQVEKSDSLVFIKRGFTPIIIVGVDVLPGTTIKIEIPNLPEYTPYDTIHELSNTYNRKSNKFEDQLVVEVPNNSYKIVSFPKEIELRINGITYTGNLTTNDFNEVLEWDGKDASGTIFYKGVEANYIFRLKE